MFGMARAGGRVRGGCGQTVEMDVQVAEEPESWQHFEAAKSLMARHGHPATPEVYAVWYAYASRQEPGLVMRIDRAMAAGAMLPLTLIKELHATFFSHAAEGDMLRRTGDQVSAELGRMLELLETAGRDTSSFGSALTRIADRLQPDGELRKIVETVVLATRHMEAKTRRLESDLDRSAVEIRTLRQGVETFKREAMTDPLTGLFNRRAFDERLRQAAAAAMETDAELCLFLSDIDNFKKLNDAGAIRSAMRSCSWSPAVSRRRCGRSTWRRASAATNTLQSCPACRSPKPMHSPKRRVRRSAGNC